MHQFKFLTVFILSQILFFQFLHAQQFSVVQVKGNKAIIELQSGDKLKVGESYSIGNNSSNHTSTAGTRDHLIGLNFEFSNLSMSPGTPSSTMALNIDMKYGWNKKQYEYGALVGMTYSKPDDDSATTLLKYGGFGTYNFQMNTPGTQMIYGVDGTFVLTATKRPLESGNGMTIEIGPSIKWFGFSDDHAITGGFYYSLDKQAVGREDVTTSGFKLIAGISTYY
jgi:hypothetical protein